MRPASARRSKAEMQTLNHAILSGYIPKFKITDQGQPALHCPVDVTCNYNATPNHIYTDIYDTGCLRADIFRCI